LQKITRINWSASSLGTQSPSTITGNPGNSLGPVTVSDLTRLLRRAASPHIRGDDVAPLDTTTLEVVHTREYLDKLESSALSAATRERTAELHAHAFREAVPYQGRIA
jgi:hypothetical protein